MRHHRHGLAQAITVLGFAGLGVALTGCAPADQGTSGTGSAGGPAQAASASEEGIDPCALIPADRLSEALGHPISQEGFAAPEARGSSCHWSFPDRPGIPGSLSITTWHGTEFFSDALGDPLSGLGDAARIDPGLKAVLFKSGDDVVQVQVLAQDGAAAAQQIARIAEAAL